MSGTMSRTMSKLYNGIFNSTRKSPSPNVSSLRYYEKNGDATQRKIERIEKKIDCSNEKEKENAERTLYRLLKNKRFLKTSLHESDSLKDTYNYNRIQKEIKNNNHFIETIQHKLNDCQGSHAGKKTRKNKKQRKTKKAKK
jgi:hypothetical protein